MKDRKVLESWIGEYCFKAEEEISRKFALDDEARTLIRGELEALSDVCIRQHYEAELRRIKASEELLRVEAENIRNAMIMEDSDVDEPSESSVLTYE